ncbi:unnamed protein product [Phaedon cochleariae]|uniref:G-protein coupled receptors family 1 profile domain-containing protein n=1 Tax=Phaedon cochleariae TaxID=80249 RepID=A0A9P0DM20_PHACE|nr:unnamed protein product [Phaedon cochleariae]
MNNTTKFCTLGAFQKGYEEIHGPLSLSVCVFGSIANILNICVLATKEMRWPTNLILTGLAVADLLVMLEYIPFSYLRYFDLDSRKTIAHYSYSMAAFTMFHAFFSQLFHFIAVCLTVILAVWRYLAITSPHNSRYWCDVTKTVYVIIFTYLACPLVCLPLLISLKLEAFNQTCDSTGRIFNNKTDLLQPNETYNEATLYVTQYSTQDYANISFWLYGVVIKLVPCILLTHLSCKLILKLLETKKRKNKLLHRDVPMKVVGEAKPMVTATRKKDRQADRTSGMLVAVLLLFLITEFPQGILGLLGAINGKLFQIECYNPLGDVMDILALTNSGINFILYCTMSRQFRTTFQEVFRLKHLLRFNPFSHYTNGIDKTQEKTQISAV